MHKLAIYLALTAVFLAHPFNLYAQTTSQKNGVTFIDYTLTIPFAVKQALPFPIEYLFGGVVLVGAIGIIVFKKKMILTLIGLIFVSGILLSFLFPDTKFYISDNELNALKILKAQPEGRVLAYEKDCFSCTYNTPNKPAAQAGKKSYIETYSEKNIDINYDFLAAKDSATARQILKDNGIKYVYLSKYGEYIETLPYSPKDLELTIIHKNTNTEIWRVK